MTPTQRRNLSKAPAKPALGRGRIQRQIVRSCLCADIRSSSDIYAPMASQDIGKMAHKSPKPRVGRIMKGIQRAFVVEPDRAWSTGALAEWTHTLPLYRGKTSQGNGTTTAGLFGGPASVCASASGGHRPAAAVGGCGV